MTGGHAADKRMIATAIVIRAMKREFEDCKECSLTQGMGGLGNRDGGLGKGRG